MIHLRNNCWCSALTIVLGCVMTVFAQSQPDEKSTEPGKGTITGRVVNESGQPLANTQVNINGYGGNEGQVVTTDADGKFQVSDLKPIAYLISAYAPGYVSKPRDPD